MNFSLFMIVAALGAIVFALVIVGMAVGVMATGRRIKGSCGGLGSMSDGESPCMACGDRTRDCEEARATADAERTQK